MSIETPPLKTLTNRQIELIKGNWKGLSENVSKSVFTADNHKFTSKDLDLH
jgi:hypothetical protein